MTKWRIEVLQRSGQIAMESRTATARRAQPSINKSWKRGKEMKKPMRKEMRKNMREELRKEERRRA